MARKLQLLCVLLALTMCCTSGEENSALGTTEHDSQGMEDIPDTTVSMETLQNMYIQQIMADAMKTLMVKVGFAIQIYYGPALSVIGILGNILCFLVMFQRHNRRISTCFYMGVLAIADSLPLGVSLGFYMTDRVFILKESVLHCQLSLFIWVFGASVSWWVTMCMTVDRAYVVRNPLKAKLWCTPRKAKVVTLCLIIISALLNVPNMYLVESFFDGRNWSCLLQSRQDTLLWTGFYWLESTMKIYIPFLIILFMNIIIIHSVRTRSGLLDKYNDSSETKDKPIELKLKKDR